MVAVKAPRAPLPTTHRAAAPVFSDCRIEHLGPSIVIILVRPPLAAMRAIDLVGHGPRNLAGSRSTVHRNRAPVPLTPPHDHGLLPSMADHVRSVPPAVPGFLEA